MQTDREALELQPTMEVKIQIGTNSIDKKVNTYRGHKSLKPGLKLVEMLNWSKNCTTEQLPVVPNVEPDSLDV